MIYSISELKLKIFRKYNLSYGTIPTPAPLARPPAPSQGDYESATSLAKGGLKTKIEIGTVPLKVINTVKLHCPYFYHRFPICWRRSGDCPWQTPSENAAFTLLAFL